jgi:hypothetical protein
VRNPFAEAIAHCPLPGWPNLSSYESLMRWETADGKVGYGPTQSVWNQRMHSAICPEFDHATDDAVVQDENETMRGKDTIEHWLATTIEKYKFHFSPKTSRTDGAQTVVTIEVSGTFPGSPVTLDYRFAIDQDRIASLTIDS